MPTPAASKSGAVKVGGNPKIFPKSSVTTHPLFEPEPPVKVIPFAGMLSGVPSTQKLKGPPVNVPPSAVHGGIAVSYTHLPSPRDRQKSRMPSSA